MSQEVQGNKTSVDRMPGAERVNDNHTDTHTHTRRGGAEDLSIFHLKQNNFTCVNPKPAPFPPLAHSQKLKDEPMMHHEGQKWEGGGEGMSLNQSRGWKPLAATPYELLPHYLD